MSKNTKLKLAAEAKQRRRHRQRADEAAARAVPRKHWKKMERAKVETDNPLLMMLSK